MTGDSSTKDVKRIAVAGATGTIGRAVVKTLVRDGHAVTALIRAPAEPLDELTGATLATADYSDIAALSDTLRRQGIECVISCLASRSGAPDDAERIDNQANLALLNAATDAGADHFILLSAICVQRPQLAFQHAKLRFESALKASPLSHTVIRPTAFFKSLSGQIDRVLNGKPFLIFGDGELTRCKPISDRDLARFVANCVIDPDLRGKILPIGGPGPAITLKQQGELLFEAAGKEPHFRSVPVALFTAVAGILGLGARVSNWFAAKAEYARIARYYATQSMLFLDPETGSYSADATPEFGEDTLLGHYRRQIAQRAAHNDPHIHGEFKKGGA